MRCDSRSRITSLLAGVFVLSVAACAKVDQASDAPGSGGGGVRPPDAGAGTGAGGTTLSGSGGSFAEGTGGRVLIATGGSGGEKSCGLEKFDLERKPAEIMLVLDRSASMKDNSTGGTPTTTDPSKWSQLIPALTAVISQSQDISWGLKSFPEGGSSCASTTVTTKIDVAVTEKNAALVQAAVMDTMPEGNGTPTSAAVRVGYQSLMGLMHTNKQFLLLATDGEPSCSGSAGALVSNSKNFAQTDAVNAVTEAATAGIHTFVVGVATKSGDTQTLNDLAVAGLEARPDPDPSAAKFYLASTQSELVTALKAITGQVTKDCVFPLSKAPPIPNNIAVKVSGVKAPQDASHTSGWDYTDGTKMTVQVYGPWCDMIKTAAANMVQIIFGCPNVEIP